MTRAFRKTVTLPPQVISLLKKGVRMTNPFSVEIGAEVNPEMIAGSVKIYGQARIGGEKTLIAEDVRLGYEAPVTLINCQLGDAVELKGGYFTDSVFLEKASLGANAQVRSGCLLEEQSGGNHTVGLKQTILFPFVTLGSLINFCDCLMAGGTSRKNHSEVGSSYIHFNYTPGQDKATASLIGDVPRGVMLKENPIFLGGQGGLIGPGQLDYGMAIPAGIIYRQYPAKSGSIEASCDSSLSGQEYPRGVHGDIRRKVYLNVLYIANLLALNQWYVHIRREFFGKQKGSLYDGASRVIGAAVTERLRQLKLFIANMENSIVAAEKNKRSLPVNVIRRRKEILALWPQMEEYLSAADGEVFGLKEKEMFMKVVRRKSAGNIPYLDAIKSLSPTEAKTGTEWLQFITSGVAGHCFPEIRTKRRKKSGLHK
jgi:bifunctional UDP-N-acetylglucosamine pyrophosphorylase / glucosamine-1-phosphate N-acetyltransferase